MAEQPYAPDAGDLIWTDFDPRTGRGQSDRQPALVISPAEFFHASAFAIVCPITSHLRGLGASVLLPPGLPIEGEVLTSHVRSIDTVARHIAYAGATVESAGWLFDGVSRFPSLCAGGSGSALDQWRYGAPVTQFEFATLGSPEPGDDCSSLGVVD